MDLRAGQDGRFSIENIVDLQSSMQGQNLNESSTNCQVFRGPGLRMFSTYVCGILYTRSSIQGNAI